MEPNKPEKIEFNKEKTTFKKFASFDWGGVGANVPLYKESFNKAQGWVNFGEDNNLPNYYLGLLARSPKHSAIINTKSQMVAGNGIVRNNLSNEALSFIQNHFSDEGYSLDEIAARISMDYEIFGAFALIIRWSNDRKTIASIDHISPQKIRVSIPDPEYPQIENYFVCVDWERWQTKGVAKYPGFSTIDRKDTAQILYVKRYVAGKEFYGEPEYMPAARWCEIEFEISNFHLMNIKNGFAPSLHINFPFGRPNLEEIEYEVRRLKNEFEGSYGAGAPFITFSEGTDVKTEIDTIDLNTSDERFVQLNQEITEGIMVGHRVTDPQLFGVMQTGVLFDSNNLIKSLQAFQSQYVTPRQYVIEREFNRLARINGIQDKFELNRYELDFDISIDVKDLMSLLLAPLPNVQKVQILISLGYREEEVEKLMTGAKEITNADQTKINV